MKLCFISKSKRIALSLILSLGLVLTLIPMTTMATPMFTGSETTGIDGSESPASTPRSFEWKYGLNGAVGFNENTFSTIARPSNNTNWRHASVSANGEIGFMESCDPNEDVFILNNTKLVTDNGSLFETPQVFPILEEQRTRAVKNETTVWGAEVTKYGNSQFGASWGTTWPRPYQPAAQYRIKNNSYTASNAESGNYNRYTNFETGEVGTQWKDGNDNQWNRRSFASRKDEVIVTYIEAPDNQDLNITMTIDHIAEMQSGGGHASSERTDYVVTQEGGKVTAIGMVGKYPVANRNGNINPQDRMFKYGGWGTATKIITDGNIAYSNSMRTFSGIQFNNPALTITGTKSIMLITKVDRIDSDCNNVDDVKTKLYDKMVNDINGIVSNYNTTNNEASYQALLAPHEEIHGGMFNSVRLDLCVTDDEKADRELTNSQLIAKQNTNNSVLNKAFLERVYNNGRYGLICASGYHSTRLGAIWTGTWDPMWSGDFTLDANTNLQISGMNTGNMQDASVGYINFIIRMIADWEAGAYNIYKAENAIMAPPRVDGTGQSGSYHFIDSGYPHIYVNGIADWLLLPIFEYWQCYGNQPIKVGKDIHFNKKSTSITSDATIASVLDLTPGRVREIEDSGHMDLEKDILLPALTKNMNFWLQFVDERWYMSSNGTEHLNDGTTLSQARETDPDARYIFTPGYSPENTPSGWRSPLAYNTAMDISAAHDSVFMAKAILDAIDVPILKKAELFELWNDFESKIPVYKYTSGGSLKEWASSRVNEQNGHRHASHAYPAWPGYEAQNDLTIRAGLQSAMNDRNNAYINEGEATESHGAMHKALIAARLKSGSEVERTIRYLLTNGYRYNSLMTSHDRNLDTRSYCSDSAFGIFGAINESLVFSDFDVIEILPALIPNFEEGSITGLRARNNTLIDNLEWDITNPDDRTASITVTTDDDTNEIKLMCGYGIDKATISGKEQPVKFDELGRSYIKLNLTKGNSVTVDLEFEKETRVYISTDTDLSQKLTVGSTVQFSTLFHPTSAASGGSVIWSALDAFTGAPLTGTTITTSGLMTIGSGAAGKYIRVSADLASGAGTSNSVIVRVSDGNEDSTPNVDAKLDGGNMVVDLYNESNDTENFQVIWAAYKDGKFIEMKSSSKSIDAKDASRFVFTPTWNVVPNETVIFIWYKDSHVPYIPKIKM